MKRHELKCEQLLAQYTPELLEEMRGVADGAAIDYDTIMTLTTTAPFDPAEMPGCSVVAVMPDRTADGRMIAGKDRHSAGYAGSQARYNRLRELLGGEKLIDVEAVKSAMADHEGGVCSHRVDAAGRKDSTIWSVVARPGERQAGIAAGHPCRTEYRGVSF